LTYEYQSNAYSLTLKVSRDLSILSYWLYGFCRKIKASDYHNNTITITNAVNKNNKLIITYSGRKLKLETKDLPKKDSDSTFFDFLIYLIRNAKLPIPHHEAEKKNILYNE